MPRAPIYLLALLPCAVLGALVAYLAPTPSQLAAMRHTPAPRPAAAVSPTSSTTSQRPTPQKLDGYTRASEAQARALCDLLNLHPGTEERLDRMVQTRQGIYTPWRWPDTTPRLFIRNAADGTTDFACQLVYENPDTSYGSPQVFSGRFRRKGARLIKLGTFTHRGLTFRDAEPPFDNITWSKYYTTTCAVTYDGAERPSTITCEGEDGAGNTYDVTMRYQKDGALHVETRRGDGVLRDTRTIGARSLWMAWLNARGTVRGFTFRDTIRHRGEDEERITNVDMNRGLYLVDKHPEATLLISEQHFTHELSGASCGWRKGELEFASSERACAKLLRKLRGPIRAHRLELPPSMRRLILGK